MLYISPNVRISPNELQFSFARSGGPGGQNVNKVSSKVILRWPVVTSPSLPNEIRARFLAKYANRVTADGDLVLISQRYRDQRRNIDDCLEKLRQMLTNVLAPPIPRRPTKPTEASKVRRREIKSKHSAKKRQRKPPQIEE